SLVVTDDSAICFANATAPENGRHEGFVLLILSRNGKLIRINLSSSPSCTPLHGLPEEGPHEAI
ncbi:MAG: hypothetical protein OEU26_17935, partial [Candidatus Tectomicrobia bacterium]|nr:hypothetical protein [Candidatus Tectomicrobia bacterium]